MKWWTDMRISRKLILTFLIVGVIPLIGFTVIAYELASSALLDEAMNKLTSVRELKAQQIEDYFEQVRNQVITFSRSTMTVNAMKEFSTAFHAVLEERELNEREWQDLDLRLKKFYSKEFMPRLEKGLGKNIELTKYLPEDKHTQLIQDLYISSNPNPVGSKQKLAGTDDDCSYSRIHKKFHPLFREFQEKFKYYDVFLVEAGTGYVVYSVMKEVAFSTSLITGPYKTGNIADIFKAASAAGSGEAKIVDFMPYHPSYNAAASFIASPVTDESNALIGVLVFQMPIHEINDIMTSHHKWGEVGLGRSGETFIVGGDYTVKNQSRHFYEEKEVFLDTLKRKGRPQKLIDDIDHVGSVIGRLTVKTDDTLAALKGETGEGIFVDYLGEPVLSAYRPLDIPGLKWAIISKKNEEEALDHAHGLRTVLFLVTFGIAVLIGLVAFFVSRSIAGPILTVANDSEALGNGDLTKTIAVQSKDEIGQLGMTLNQSISQLKGIVFNVKRSIRDITQTSEEIAEGGSDLATRSNQQAASVTETSAVIEEFSAALKQSSENAVSTNTRLEEFIHEVQSKMELIDNVTRTMKEIEDSGSRIGSFIGVINDISFQTNLLALNAAVEAARAGDAGRGFAVVASEVRNLAQKTAEASNSIQEIISRNAEATGKGMELVNQTADFFSSIRNVTQEVSGRVQTIADSSREQENGVEQITSAILQLEEVIGQNAALAEEFASTVSSLKSNARELESLVDNFKVDDGRSGDDNAKHRKNVLRKLAPKKTIQFEKESVLVKGNDFFIEEEE